MGKVNKYRMFNAMLRRTIPFLTLTVVAGLSCYSRPTSNKRTNILLINIDDMGWRDVGFMGSKYYETPNIDKLATRGMVFTNAYAAAANCAPSRACMMSGQWTPRHGIYTVANSDRGKAADRKLIPTTNNETLSDQNTIIAEVLKNAGYTTCIAGKWHLSDDPTQRGFDLNIGGSHAGSPGSYSPPYKNIPLEPPAGDYDLTRLITDKSIDFLKSVSEKPFFLYYAPYAVHTPLQPIKDLLPKYAGKAAWNGQNNPVYASMVENLDTQLERVITFMTEHNLIQNTFILLTSDNGGVYNITKQWPLRAGKGSCYEGGVREPMVVCWPGKVKAGTSSEVPVTSLDFFPTLLEVAGVVKDPDKVLDGESLVPVLTGKGVITERPLFWHFPVYLEGGNRETQDTIFRTRPGSSVRLGDWKLIQYFENNDLELYNLREDIGEKVNRFRSDTAKTTELLAILEKWRRETNAPVPVALNPSFAKP
jgi:arylsulfatase A-like enzyme